MATIGSPQTHHRAERLLPVQFRRYIPLLAVVGISLGVVGYSFGIRERPKPYRAQTVLPASTEGIPAAADYLHLMDAHLKPNANRRDSLSQLRFDKPKITDQVNRTEEMKQAALAHRAINRAYDGAPPTIPHPVISRTASDCLVCHEQGLKISDRVASKISHAVLSNCTQCHVEKSFTGFARNVEMPKNDFAGMLRSGPGDRANPGAPPTIPHHLWLREDCMSCHGLVTRPGIRTTHPWLSNCTQCHVTSVKKTHDFFAKD